MIDKVQPLTTEQKDLVEEILSGIRPKLWVDADLSAAEPSTIFVPEIFDVK